MSHPVTDIAIAELAAVGIKGHVEIGGKHPHVVWTMPDGTERRFACSGTPSDHRTPLNTRRDIRRVLREAGLTVSEEPELAPVANVALVSGKARCTSLDIAKDFDKQHKDVLRVIDRVRGDIGEEFDQRNFAPISYLDEKGRSYRAFSLTRDGFVMVCMGFTGPKAASWKARYIEAFNAMEAELAAIAARQVAPDPALASLKGDLEALTDIVLSLPAPARVSRGPWVNPNHIYRQRRAERRQRRSA